MSLILEALRKSEAERRRGQAPDVAMELPPLAARRATAWPPWWPLLALAAGIVLGIAWWQQRDATPVAQDPIPSPPSPRVDGEPRAPAVVIAPAAPPGIAIPATRPAPAPPTPVDDAPRPTPAPVAAAAPVVAPAPAPVPADPVADIGDTPLPAVRMSMHMWNEVPSQRFVILDGQRMVEGDRKGELLLVAIERDGVLVERNGQRARIPLR